MCIKQSYAPRRKGLIMRETSFYEHFDAAPLNDYELAALRYAETYGIIEYHVKGNKMIYYTSWPMEHETYKAVVDLDLQSETRTEMSKYYPAYDSLIGGRYQANYMV